MRSFNAAIFCVTPGDNPPPELADSIILKFPFPVGIAYPRISSGLFGFGIGIALGAVGFSFSKAEKILPCCSTVNLSRLVTSSILLTSPVAIPAVTSDKSFPDAISPLVAFVNALCLSSSALTTWASKPVLDDTVLTRVA